MRITSKYLQNWLSNKFKELEIPWQCVDVVRSGSLGKEVEAGACFLYFRIKPLREDLCMYDQITMLGFYSMGQYQKLLNSGHELYLKFDKHMILSNCEVEIRKVN